MDQSKIRNFCIIAHIDHGKSTLADRFLEVTGTVEKRKMKEQLLDQMDLERERGITIKLQPVRMDYNGYELNLIDTPGHVDFAYEVSRSLAACEGAILVVDATQGIQAQTLANVKLAMEHDLVLIPVINKIDLPNASPEEIAIQVKDAFGFADDEIIFASGKTGENVDKIIEAVIARVPAPKGQADAPLQALIFDSKYDKHQGVIAYVRIVSGGIGTNEGIKFINTSTQASSIEVGYFTPQFKKDLRLETGEVGYIVTGLREVSKARVGDTITSTARPSLEPLPGYKDIKPMVFASIFPESGDDYPTLRDAMDKLKLNDASLSFEPESIPSLGFGFRTGFLGLLHMDIIRERLTREFNLDLVLTAPSVAYVVHKRDHEETTVYNPSQLPDPAHVEALLEPWVTLDIITPEKYLGGVMSLVTGRRGIYKDTTYLGPGRLNLHFEIPLANIVSDFYDKLKSISSGYASMNYDFLEYRAGDLVKLDVLVAEDRVDALALIVHRSIAESEGRRIVEKLKTLIPKQQFPVALQAAIGGKIVARETIPAMRKDVTAGLYGGDVTRKQKVLKKQKKGKARLKASGRVEIPQEAFISLMKR
ncbi:MAG: elongation factor 4 [Candidatus Doudnabacteria bacterium RIFCSPHIGHO2_02_FULL_48_21]|uniref:Elongation factor 4 n=1 Tax=Candidatus Doudnabacteria bacterium RIFCSPLOWO2_02_FULL_48_13 TaxID=1817845 RepID=A0A1F5QCQ3_9BACT|nr:MAG: elongation factor 4 [Candidatus Doudnabacteria bacterium RIFCSPHIGHO2_01_48_18]OGE79162.1 MAG: elongation factor 4 [Candidatus Doudnabacteria bacterium RIFCSPHIGHO2_01_FULL_48_180]OGE91794.1 MAG: elongation factor 4 [Candidatus Doudnabacteria bacterium RIFCSPHIGHO2_12_FULL_47_25]OGE93644.1 MAG: elongation factor 4 [Candidatus Doudnabacteria bacterium RIFCSPHIGHO2_02_FULL_48_21]OGE97925.1 MAG: elongation factor 4 [Candidatus Doudnabacteria bacterium RIFCSPLOWO2_01_FULL_48_57]OGE99959.1 